MLPADLLSNRQGRAAMRLSGLSYRQIKAGSELHGKLLDYGGGWKLIETARHKDAVNYDEILDEFWHSELASDPDNQNKDKVRVFRGVNEQGQPYIYRQLPWRAESVDAFLSTGQVVLLEVFLLLPIANALYWCMLWARRRARVDAKCIGIMNAV